MEGIARTQEEAIDQLLYLRKERGVDGNQVRDSALTSSLNQALNILSDQLYQTTTHFLLELIQNADDNLYYAGEVPSLSLSLYRRNGWGYLRSDCNETGFTFRQLDSLMRVGQSTKGPVGGSKGYIGEKGIGFKSVFKVADVVRIASGFYEFKFDRNQPIGMILPIPARFPVADRAAHHTQVVLELKHERDLADIREELEGIEPHLLIFLRKLGQLTVFPRARGMVFQRQIIPSHMGFGGEVVRISKRDSITAITTHQDFVVHRNTVQILPLDPRREGVASSEVVVAFSIRDRGIPVPNTQKAFAFLPIDNYGFRFLIHADFILVASRESLDYSCPWNLALRIGIQDAFIDAVFRFVSLPLETQEGRGLRYSWPAYLPRNRGSPRFWNMLHDGILHRLRTALVLETRQINGPYQMPSLLFYVPKEYRFRYRTLFDVPSIRKSHLSFAYDHVKDSVCQIGVKILGIGDLCREFSQWIGEVGVAGIAEQPTEWHSHVSSVFCDRALLKERLQNFPIIPLRDGSWVNAKEPHVYFAARDEDEHVPAGVSISIVDRQASQDPMRRRFLRFLGISEYSPRQVCKLILELHNDEHRSEFRANKNLVTDVAYLFKHKSQLKDIGLHRIIFVTQKSSRLTRTASSQTYLIDPAIEPSLVAKYSSFTGTPFAILSDKYYIEICKEGMAEQFRKWLLGLQYSIFATIPTLVRDGELSSEWWFLRDHDVIDLLHGIKLHSERGELHPKILEAAPELQVSCLNGVTMALGLLALPTGELTRACPHLDFASLPDPTLAKWGFLVKLGVITTCNTTARIHELQKLKELHLDISVEDSIHKIYQKLNSSTSFVEIRAAFRKSPLIFTNRPNPKWLSLTSCVWTAPAPLRRVFRLEAHYGNFKTLFSTILGVSPAGIGHVVDELCSISDEETPPAQRFEELFSLLGGFLSDTHKLHREQIQRIRNAPVFPIVRKLNSSQDDSETSWQSASDSLWYIADKSTLERAFRRKVDMLSLPVRLVRASNALFKELGLQDLFISFHVKETTSVFGTSIRDICREDDLKIRLKHLYQLKASDMRPMEGLHMPQVWSVPSIKMIRFLGAVEGTNEEGLVMINDTGPTTKVYIHEGIGEFDQPTVNFELLEYYIGEFAIDLKHINTANHMMSAPISWLPEIMKKHDIPLPGDEENHSDRGDSDHGETSRVHRDVNSRMASLSVEAVHGGSSARRSDDLEPGPQERGDGAERLGLTSDAHSHSPFSQPLRELIPSHQSRIDSITQRAGGASRHHPPMPARDNRHGDQGNISPGLPNAAEGSYADFSTGHTPSIARPQIRHAPVRDGVKYREIGFSGELFVYETFLRRIDDWTFENWTSKLRTEGGHPRFAELEKEFSDFTYRDRSGHMKNVLSQIGVDLNPEWTHDTTFHLEVKATLGPCNEPFFVSQNQLDKMRLFDGDIANAYLLLRVFNLEDGSSPNIKFFRDLWSLYMDKVIDFRSDQGYKVYALE